MPRPVDPRPQSLRAYLGSLAAAAVLAFGVACDSGGGTEPPAPLPAPPAVTLSVAGETVFRGDPGVVTVHFAAAVDSARRVVDVTWTSSDTTVAVVTGGAWTDTTATGLVTARGDGPVTVTARVRNGAGGIATASGRVTARALYALRVWPDTNALIPGLSRQLAAQDAVPGTAQPPSVAGARWSSDAPQVATVDDSGRVTAVAAGRATISATADGGRRASAVVVVRDYGGPLAFTQLTAGRGFAVSVPTPYTCGLTDAGRAFCWGGNSMVTLGTAAPMDRCETSYMTAGGGGIAPRTVRVAYRCSAVPAEVDGGLRFAQLSAYSDHVCGVSADGGVYCWGQNPYGAAGTGEVTGGPPSGATPADIGAPLVAPRRADAAVRFRQVSAGDQSTCALAEGGAAYCWGRNRVVAAGTPISAPRLGVGSADEVVARPRPVVGGLTFASVTAGDTHACGLTAGGAAWCWGDNAAGQLGDGRARGGCDGLADTACYAYAVAPRPVAGGLRFADLRAGHDATCGVEASGALWCWGYVGVGPREPVFGGSWPVSRSPARFEQGPALARLVAPPWGDFQTPGPVCGLESAGAVTCLRATAPAELPLPGRQFAAVASSGWPWYGRSACGLGPDGTAYCWYGAAGGGRGDGQLTAAADLTGVVGKVAGQR